MTALTSGAREAGGRQPLLDSLTGMAWAVWRQHRSALGWLGALVLALGGAMLAGGIELHRLYNAELRHGCLGASAWSGVCRPLQTPFALGWPQSYVNLDMLAMQTVPVIIGVFLGAPLLAREYQAGTVRFAWTQGIGRTRWAVATLGLLGAAVAAAGALLGLLTQWSVQPVAAQTSRLADRWEPGIFNSSALTAATAALLAFALGVLAGALIRRVVAAMAVTAVCVITVAVLTYNRLHYWLVGLGARLARDPAFGASPNVAASPDGVINIHETVGPSVPGPAGAWLDRGWYAGAGGHRLFWITYQPGQRYWVFQLALAGATLLAALLLGAGTIALIRHRRALRGRRRALAIRLMDGREQRGVGADQRGPLQREQRAVGRAAFPDPPIGQVHGLYPVHGGRPDHGLELAVEIGVQPGHRVDQFVARFRGIGRILALPVRPPPVDLQAGRSGRVRGCAEAQLDQRVKLAHAGLGTVGVVVGDWRPQPDGAHHQPGTPQGLHPVCAEAEQEQPDRSREHLPPAAQVVAHPHPVFQVSDAKRIKRPGSVRRPHSHPPDAHGPPFL
jgi:hypothetical protein